MQTSALSLSQLPAFVFTCEKLGDRLQQTSTSKLDKHGTAVPATRLERLQTVVDGDWRPEDQKARDVFRNPAETLDFFSQHALSSGVPTVATISTVDVAPPSHSRLLTMLLVGLAVTFAVWVGVMVCLPMRRKA